MNTWSIKHNLCCRWCHRKYSEYAKILPIHAHFFPLRSILKSVG